MPDNNEKLIEEARRPMTDLDVTQSPDATRAFIRRLADALEAAEKANTPTDDELAKQITALHWGVIRDDALSGDIADAGRASAALLRRFEGRGAPARITIVHEGGNSVTGTLHEVLNHGHLKPGWRYIGEEAPDLDPQPWVFVSDQVFGVRSATDKGFHAVSGAYYAFQPRPKYEQDRARYESAGGVR